MVDASLKVSPTGIKLKRMHVYYLRCYWPLNVLFFVRCMTYISNLRKIGQKLLSLSKTIPIGTSDRRTDIQTDKHSSDFISVHCHALHWTDNTQYSNRHIINTAQYFSMFSNSSWNAWAASEFLVLPHLQFTSVILWRHEYTRGLLIKRSEVRPLLGHCCATTLGKLITPLCLCQAV